MSLTRSASGVMSRPPMPGQQAPLSRRPEQNTLARTASRGMLIPSDSMRMPYGAQSARFSQDRSSRAHSETRYRHLQKPQQERVHSWPKATSSTSPANLPVPHAVDELDKVLSAGDVLLSKSAGGNVLEIGTMGGYFGHVMLVTGTARMILRGSPQAFDYLNVWPADADVLWAVPFIECMRGVLGLHKAVLLLKVNMNDGSIVPVAEENPATEELLQCEGDQIEVFQSPYHLRQLINSCAHRAELLSEVLAEMIKDMNDAKWSETTAVRAFLMSSTLDRSFQGTEALQQVYDSWSNSPICTSVVISFWQRYLCKLAPHVYFGHARDEAKRATDLIHRWMPLHADRSLPSDLVEIMETTGWIKCKPLQRLVSL